VSLSKKQVLHVANLAKLKLSGKDVNKFKKQLSEVIGYFEQLKEIDTSKTEPASQTTGLENVLRNDEINTASSLKQKDALSGTEDVHNGYFKVPAVIKKD